MRKLTLAAAITAALPFSAQALDTEFSYGGFIKLDAMMSQYSNGEPTTGAPDFYNPGATNTQGDKTTRFDTSARTSRFNFKTVTTLDNGEKVTGFVELDFLGAGGGNKAVTNGYNPRLRHAYFTYKNWMVGQNWSTFMDLSALPETMDVIGPSEGLVMVRQPQIRYSNGGFHIALESAETTESSKPKDDSRMPDLVARYNFNIGSSTFSVAALARELRVNEKTSGNTTGKDVSTFGGGVSVAGTIKLGQLDNIKFGANYGNTARYVGLGPITDSLINAVDKDLEATKVFGAYVAGQHFWTEKLRTTVMYSHLHGSYDDSVKIDGLNETSRSARANLVYAPNKALSYGVEYTYAKLEKTGGDQGHLNRIHLTAKYAF